MTPAEASVADIGAYLRLTKPAPSSGHAAVQDAFLDGPTGAPPVLEFLLRRWGASLTQPLWYVRWPNGSVRWEPEESLRAKGHTIPAEPMDIRQAVATAKAMRRPG